MRKWRQFYYDRFSSLYDRFVALHSSDRQGKLRAYLAKTTAVLPGHKVLDVCTGTGSLLESLEKQIGPGGLVVGLDFSWGMLSVANDKLASSSFVSIIQADAARLPFKSAVFDAVTCAHAFYELKGANQTACLREVRRVLKPSKPFLMMEHEMPQKRLVRLLFYVRLLSMGAKRAMQILKNERQFLEQFFPHVQKRGTPTGNSKIWLCSSNTV
jgi:demethylmenaquinone methyltransferase/2-methoxy-6-polyprenyl-1,4-benzoquinol methylase